MPRYVLPVAAIAAGLLGASPARADTDTHAWTQLNATASLSQRVTATFEGQLRLTDDASRAGQVLIRPSIGYKLGPNTTASLGYAYFRFDPPGPALRNEHRIWQQMAFRLAGDGKGVTVTGRSRLEQRFSEGSGDVGHRYRQQVRVTGPIDGKVRVVGWSEPFFNLNETNWVQDAGLDRLRNFAGVSVPVNKVVTLEPGYLNEWVVRPGQDRVNHIASLTIWARF